MSTHSAPGDASSRTSSKRRRVRTTASSPRSLALLGLAALTLGYVTTLYWVTTIAGGTAWLAGGVAIGVGAGVLLRNTGVRRVLQLAGAGTLVAGGLYHSSAGPAIEGGAVVAGLFDGLAMVTGISVLRLAAVDVWIGVLVPVPVFLTTYLGLRRRYALAAAAGGWLVLFLAATGDAALVETLLGSVGAAAAIGFGELDRHDGSIEGVDVLLALIAVMAVLAVAVPMAPSGATSTIDPQGDSSDVEALGEPGDGSRAEAVALDEQLLSGDAVSAGGPINLSPDVRMVVESEERRRYRLDALDRYDGDGWTRTGQNSPLGALEGPPGESRTVTQRFDLRAPAEDVPAVASPVDVRGVASEDLEVTDTGGITVDGRLPANTTLTVQSEVPEADASRLQNAGTDYPTHIEDRYTRLPADTVPSRVHNLTDEVTAQASTPYGKATVIESYLEENKGYSQDVAAPSGTMADSFLFEMDAGYCTYFAGTMATMLRAEGVPARVAVGYAGGQWAGNDTWVVRGTDAHAWVEVYFPEVGWVEFDPTPAGDVQNARTDAVADARSNGTDAVDVPESEGEELRFERPAEPDDGGGETDSSSPDGGNGDGSDPDGVTDGENAASDDDARPAGAYSGVGFAYADNGSLDYVEPDMGAYAEGNATGEETVSGGTAFRETGDRLLGEFDVAVVALLLVAGTVAGGRRAGVGWRLRHAGTVLWQRRRDPETDVRVAVERLDAILANRFEPRHDGETRREYARRLPDHVDADVHRAFELHEQVRYAGDVDRETADELVGIVDGIARQRVPGLGRLE